MPRCSKRQSRRKRVWPRCPTAWWSESKSALADGFGHELRAIARIRFGQQTLHVKDRGRFRDAQGLRDFAVLRAFREQIENLPLAFGKAEALRQRLQMAAQPHPFHDDRVRLRASGKRYGT